MHGFLAYDNGKPVCWCNAASRYGDPGIEWLMGPSKGLFCGTYWLGVLRFKVIIVGLSLLGALRVLVLVRCYENILF